MEEQEYPVGDGWICHTPDPNNYHDINNMSLSTMGGRAMSSALSGRFGLRGVVLPRSTLLGGSRNKNVFKTGPVNIDPGYRGEKAIQIDLSQLTEEALEEAIAENADSSEDM